MEKQTAVEWLVEKLEQNFDYVADTIIEQAKEMEKEQMKDAYYQGSGDEAEEHGIDAVLDLTDAERYYNTYYRGQDESKG